MSLGSVWKFLSWWRFYHYELRRLPNADPKMDESWWAHLRKFTITITLGKFNFFIFARVKTRSFVEEWKRRKRLKEIIVKCWKACAFMFHQNKHIKEEKYPERLQECIITWCSLSGRFQNIHQLTFLSLSARCLLLLPSVFFHSWLLRWNLLITQSWCLLFIFLFFERGFHFSCSCLC